MMHIESLGTQAGIAAAAHSRLYRLLADGFLYPDRESFDEMKAGRFRDYVVETCHELPYALEPAFDGLVASGDYVNFQSEFLSLFEVGQGMAACPGRLRTG